jgi:uncharacterized protein (DUF58 family)
VRHLAGFALTWASIFLAIVAVLIGSPALFYITTALIATIGASNLQAFLAVRGLRVERIAPDSVRVGELVIIEMTVWSLKRVRRTLVTVWDNLPSGLELSHRSPSLPIAPAFDFPVRTQYQIRVLKRGLYRWSSVIVTGTDALGLVTRSKEYQTLPAEMIVLPRPIPVAIELPAAAGWGVNESESGQTRGAGIEPRGIRQYRSGDPLRHVHWPSSVRTGQLLVKEFEAGTQAAAAFCIQRGKGTEVGKGAATSLEHMCGNVAFLAETFLRQGARVCLPGLDSKSSHYAPHERIAEIYHALALVNADSDRHLAEDLAEAMQQVAYGSVLYVLAAVAEPDLPDAVARAVQHGARTVALLYDAAVFQKGKPRSTVTSAVDADFIARLRGAGALPIVVPVDITESA